MQNDPSPTKIKHVFSLQNANDNSRPRQFEGTQAWGIKSKVPTSFQRDMVPFILSNVKKQSEHAMGDAQKIIEHHRRELQTEN